MGAIDYIDTEKTTIRILKDWLDQRWKLETAAERIEEINDRMLSSRSSFSSAAPVQGGASRTEEELCNAIDRKEAALYGLKKATEYDRDVSCCWDRLTADEQFCLSARFIEHEEGNGIRRIMERFNIERSEAYRRSEAALKRLARLLFW